MRFSSSFLFPAALSLSGPALAQTASERAACQADFEKYCPGVAPGGGRIVECLSQHMQKLTAECQKVVKENTPQ
jgi:hypothetical protein